MPASLNLDNSSNPFWKASSPIVAIKKTGSFDFSLINENGQELNANDFKDKWNVFFIYPRDNTPNCTNESYYKALGICHPDNWCKLIKNPVNYTKRRLKVLNENKPKRSKK